MKISMKSVVQQFKLSGDPSGESGVTIRQVRTDDAIHLGDLFAEQTYTWDDENNPSILRKWNPEKLKRARVYRTMVQVDIEDEDETGESVPVFKTGKNGVSSAMTESAFNIAWGKLPQGLADEIYEYVLIVNPMWDVNSGE